MNVTHLLDTIAETLEERGDEALAAEVDLLVPMFVSVKRVDDPVLPPGMPACPELEQDLNGRPMGLPDVPTGHEGDEPAPMGIPEPEWREPAGLQPPYVPQDPPPPADFRSILDGIANALEERNENTLAQAVDACFVGQD